MALIKNDLEHHPAQSANFQSDDKLLMIVQTPLINPALPSPNNLGARTSGFKSRKVSIVPCKKMSQNVDKTDANDQHKNEKSGDLMSQSFGEGYATRADEEGFGGIYGGNTTDPEGDPAKRRVHESHPHYDKEQGSHVKDKEKARNQSAAHS